MWPVRLSQSVSKSVSVSIKTGLKTQKQGLDWCDVNIHDCNIVSSWLERGTFGEMERLAGADAKPRACKGSGPSFALPAVCARASGSRIPGAKDKELELLLGVAAAGGSETGLLPHSRIRGWVPLRSERSRASRL